MIYLNNFDTHTSYEENLDVGGIDFEIPNVSYCKDVKDVHFNPYNLIKFYVGEITEPQTVKIYTENGVFNEVQVSESNKWYSYVLQKDEKLFKISGNTVTKVKVKANINTIYTTIIPETTIEASFKNSNTSNVTNMESMFNGCSSLEELDLSGLKTSNVTNMTGTFYNSTSLTSLDLSSFDTRNVTTMNTMFGNCSGLTSLDLSKWDTSKVTNMSGMFEGCTSLKKITMKKCTQETITKIQNQLTYDGITGATIIQ